MNMERVILHSDANSFYASVECARNPSIRDKPVAVCGDPEARHGIVLTKNEHAKKFGIKTGEAMLQKKMVFVSLLITWLLGAAITGVLYLRGGWKKKQVRAIEIELQQATK